MNITVIKLGGSLIGESVMTDWLNYIKEAAREENIIIVPGGGLFTDQVRDRQRLLKFDDLAAHRMALFAMCQTAYLLKWQCPVLVHCHDSDTILSLLNRGLPIVWLPLELLEDTSNIPASWDYTSDSIALWLACRLLAMRLVLVKKVPPPGNILADCVNNNYIDKGFQLLINSFKSKIYVISGSKTPDFSNDDSDWARFELKRH